MSRHRLSFTQRRRVRLALKFGRLDPLEERKTITEPISVSGLAFNLPLAWLQAGGTRPPVERTSPSGDGPSTLARRTVRIATAGVPSLAATIPLRIVPRPGRVGSGSKAAAGAPGAPRAVPTGVGFDLTSPTASAPLPARAAPWRPARPMTGGEALPARGVGGGGASAGTAKPSPHTTSALAPPPAQAAGFGGTGPAASPLSLAAGTTFTRTAVRPIAPAPAPPPRTVPASVPPGPLTVDGPTGSFPATAPENASSLPFAAGGGAAPASFPYYPLYVLDSLDGVTLAPGQYQLGAVAGYVDLRAQARDATGVTFSWDTS